MTHHGFSSSCNSSWLNPVSSATSSLAIPFSSMDFALWCQVRVENIDLLDQVRVIKMHDGIEKAYENVPAVLGAEDLFEGEISFRVQKSHVPSNGCEPNYRNCG